MAAGGTGKTALRTAQALSLAAGRPLTGEHIFQQARVLIVSLEDDRDEQRRRVRAAMQHHGVTQEEIRGWLWLATPAEMGWKLAASRNGGIEIGELGAKLVETIQRRQIDLVMLDPLVKTHSVAENGNGDIDMVASILAQIAVSCDCGVDAPHHVAKGASDPGNADRGRGASAFKDAARLVYTLATMTPEEAQTFGVREEDRRAFVRMDSAKVNLAPSIRKAMWFKLIGIRLGNGAGIYPHGDEVQTIEPWTPPDAWSDLSHPTLNGILNSIAKGLGDGRLYSNEGPAKERAAWRVIVEHAPQKTEQQAREIIRTWIKTGLLTVEQYDDPVRRTTAKGLRVTDAKRPA
jgi:hypothetical protein